MSHTPPPPHDHGTEDEWLRQEQAFRAERLGLDSRDPASVQRYRTIVRALRQPTDENLPNDFAAQVAAQARRRDAADMRLELWLSWTLAGVLMTILVGLTMLYGSTWLPLAQSILPMHLLLNPWLLALAACIAMSAALSRWVPTQRTP